MATDEVELWLADFAEALGVGAPTGDEIDQVLRLASVAAHASARRAAPVACWLSARADVSIAAALRVAEGLANP